VQAGRLRYNLDSPYYYPSFSGNFSQKPKAGPRSKPVILSPPRDIYEKELWPAAGRAQDDTFDVGFAHWIFSFHRSPAEPGGVLGMTSLGAFWLRLRCAVASVFSVVKHLPGE